MLSPRSRIAAVAGLCLVLGGCADYMASRDSITLGAGNAMEANVGIHTIDPFPPAAQRTTIHTDGSVVARTQRIYRRTPVAAPAAATNN